MDYVNTPHIFMGTADFFMQKMSPVSNENKAAEGNLSKNMESELKEDA